MSRRVDFAVFDAVGGVPVISGASVTPESGGWYTVTRASARLHLFAGGILVDGRALCAVVGRPAVVAAAVALASSNVGRGAGALAGAPLATRRRWAHWRVTGEYAHVGPDGEATSIPFTSRRVTLPTPLPGTALPWTFGALRVDSLDGPCLPSSIAGHTDADDADTGGPEAD